MLLKVEIITFVHDLIFHAFRRTAYSGRYSSFYMQLLLKLTDIIDYIKLSLSIFGQITWLKISRISCGSKKFFYNTSNFSSNSLHSQYRVSTFGIPFMISADN